VTVIVNLTADPVPLPPDHEILLTSAALGPGGVLPPDTAVWLRAR
jgi:alpha-glucosidase